MPAIDPPPVPRPRRRLDEAALQRLEALLDRHVGEEGVLPLEMIDGCFTAALLAPHPAAFEEALDAVVGDPSAWHASGEAEEAGELMRRLWEHIAQRLPRDPETAPDDEGPLLSLPEEFDPEDDADWAAPVGAGWALGFRIGMRLRADAWDALVESDASAARALDDILALIPAEVWDDIEAEEDAAHADDGVAALLDGGGASRAGVDIQDGWRAGDDSPGIERADVGSPEDDFDDEDAEDEAELSPGTRREIVGDLPFLLHDLYLSSFASRTAHEPVRRTAVPGRNDPCPCGSGLKYKKCHGDPARLH